MNKVMNKEGVRTNTLNLPSLSLSKKHERVCYKRFFVPSPIEDVRIPLLDFKRLKDSVDNKLQSKSMDKRLAKLNNGRINCVSVLPNRDFEYVSRRLLKRKLKINLDLPKVTFVSKTPINHIENLTPSVNKITNKQSDVKSLKYDAMVNTDS